MAAPTPVPLRLPAQMPAPAAVELRTGFGLSPADGGTVARREPRTTRLDRRVRIRSRWSAEDEFRRAGRAELFSDDARYQVLFALTAAWYVPVALVYLAWVLLFTRDGSASDALSGLVWLGGSAVVSLAVAGLLRWAGVGWRALTLTVAAALIGGGVTTVANTLTG